MHIFHPCEAVLHIFCMKCAIQKVIIIIIIVEDAVLKLQIETEYNMVLRHC